MVQIPAFSTPTPTRRARDSSAAQSALDALVDAQQKGRSMFRRNVRGDLFPLIKLVVCQLSAVALLLVFFFQNRGYSQVSSGSSETALTRQFAGSFQVSGAPQAKVTGTQVKGTFQPVSCRFFSRENEFLSVTKHTKAFLLRTMTHSPFYISLHDEKVDRTRWIIWSKRFYYEKVLERIWNSILLESPPGSHVIDVGGNIGYYSLVSASLGNFVIDAFEPNDINIMRFCESIMLNDWDHTISTGGRSSVRVYPYGVSNKPGTMTFRFARNPGAGSFDSSQESRHNGSKELPVITLDDFVRDKGYFESRPVISIMKVDVEGHEAPVLLGAKELFKARLVKNVLMEVSPTDANADMLQEAFNNMMDSGYVLIQYGGFSGPKTPSTWPMDRNLVSNLKSAQGRDHLNLWWQLDGKVAAA